MSKSPAIKANCQTSNDNAVVCVRVSPDDYCRMTISTRKLVRRDDKAAGLRVKDVETGERFFIDEKGSFLLPEELENVRSKSPLLSLHQANSP